MKKMLLKFADQVLSREELKAVRGASGSCGTCNAGYGSSGCVRNAGGGCNCILGLNYKCSGGPH